MNKNDNVKPAEVVTHGPPSHLDADEGAPWFFSGKVLGQSLKQIAVDLIKTDKQDLVSRWYHSSGDEMSAQPERGGVGVRSAGSSSGAGLKSPVGLGGRSDRGSTADLYTWADQSNHIIKQQLNFNGQVVEWNCLEGIKTGLVVETPLSNVQSSGTPGGGGASNPTAGASGAAPAAALAVSETIHFDALPQGPSIHLALSILEHCEIESVVRDQVISNFRDPQSLVTMAPDQFLRRFGVAINTRAKPDAGGGLWQSFKALFGL